MTSPTLTHFFLDAELLFEAAAEPHPGAEELARLIEDLRPTLKSTLGEFEIPPDEAWMVLHHMVCYAVVHWGETGDAAPWLVEILRDCCRDHRICGTRASGCGVAPGDHSFGSQIEDGGAAQLATDQRCTR
jgi:hypothetical protein